MNNVTALSGFQMKWLAVLAGVFCLAMATASNQPPPASFSLTADPALTSSSGNIVRMHDLSGTTLNSVRGVMSHKQWSGDSDDKFIKRLADSDLTINEVLAVLVHYHNDSKMNLTSRLDDLTGPMLKRLCLAIGLIVDKKERVILIRKQIMDFVLLYANKYPHLVMSITTRS